AEDGIRDDLVTGVQTCALPIWTAARPCAGDGSADVSLRLGPRAAVAHPQAHLVAGDLPRGRRSARAGGARMDAVATAVRRRPSPRRPGMDRRTASLGPGAGRGRSTPPARRSPALRVGLDRAPHRNARLRVPELRGGMTARPFAGLRVTLVAAFNPRYHRSGLALAAALAELGCEVRR